MIEQVLDDRQSYSRLISPIPECLAQCVGANGIRHSGVASRPMQNGPGLAALEATATGSRR